MTDRSGEKVSRLSDQSIESIESYHEPTQTLQLRSLCQEDEGGNATRSRSESRDGDVLLTDSVFEGTVKETTGQDVIIQRTSNEHEVTGPSPVPYRTQEGPSQTEPTASVSPQSASSKKVVKNSKKVKRRAKSEEHFDVPAALKSLRRRPRSGFPLRPSIIAQRGVYRHSSGSEEDQLTASGGGAGRGGREDHSWQVTSDGDPQAGYNQSCGSNSTLDSCSRDSWVDESNENSSSCSSPLDSGRQGHHEAILHQRVQQTSDVEELTDRPADRPASAVIAAEADMCSRLQRTSISSGEGQSATADSRDIESRSMSPSSNPSSEVRIRNRESMALAMENPPEEQFTTVVGSMIRISPSAQSEATVSPTPNIFVTSSPQNICQNMLSPARTPETLPAAFVFPDQSHNDSRQRTASVAPAPSQSSRSAATFNSAVVTPPRQPSLSGRRGEGRGRPTDYSDIPAALKSLRRKPRSGFGQRTSFMNRMQVGPQESTRVDATLARSQSLDNSEPSLESAMPNTSDLTMNDSLPASRGIQHQSQIDNQDQREPSVSRTILEAIANVTVSTRAHDQEPAALRSLRRHPRSGFQRRRPGVSGHFSEACSEPTASGTSGATVVPSASVDETAEVGRRSETPSEPDEQVVVSRRPALPDPDRSSPPPSYDDLFFYPVGDDIADVAEAFLPDQFSPRLPSYDDVLRLSQESPPPYMETPTADDTELDS